MNSIAAQVAHQGLSLVFANVLLQQAGVPVPAEPTLVVAGSLAAKRLMSGAGLVVVTVAAATLADVSWFLLGRRWGPRILRFVARFSKAAGAASRGENAAFSRWGLRSLVVAKFLPGASQLIVPISGATGVAFRSFIFYDLLGTLVWASVPIGSGVIFHRQVDDLLAMMSRAGVWLALALGVVAAVVIAWRRVKRRQDSQISVQPVPAHPR